MEDILPANGISHRGGVAWACRWNPAPNAAPLGLCRVVGVLIVFTPWCRWAARGSRDRSGGGCPASPGRRACGSLPGRTGPGPIPPTGLRDGRCDDHRAGFERVHHRADAHRPRGAVGDGPGLMGQAACGHALPRTGVAVALPPATVTVGTHRPLPPPDGPLRSLAVPQRSQTAGAVLGGAPGGHGDHRDPHLGAPLRGAQDAPGHLLGHAHDPVVDTHALRRFGGSAVQPRRRSAIHAFEGNRRPVSSTLDANASTSAVLKCSASNPVDGRHQISTPAHTFGQR